ncbi:Hypothetical protein PENO1_008740 [Penicillium occitanis (nom. inval.)]|nr:Hypothetical protein PENO1_008740 [Penicillium occitanis (nom. inval.)]PCH10013.1 hypothetical protein PENOC_005380 [Penicillium occitanis (nom. inval.)]
MADQHASFQSSANINSSLSSANLRQRPLGRATTFAEASPSKYRRNSAISETVSEARQSIRDSTDELLFPRAKAASINPRIADAHHHDSHWQSAPLALALLPAVGGMFFDNGSAFVTDATLLILAAVFLNWSVRLPWDWYRSAQEIRQPLPETLQSDDGTIAEEDGDDDNDEDKQDKLKKSERKNIEQASHTAIKELHFHELAALVSCFVFPLIGAWLLHGIRGALSRPSEGLVSNYNLTIFLLAAEIRPFAHLLRMVQGRTLYLQRVVTAADEEEDEDGETDHNKILDISARLDDLEAHVADKAATTPGPNSKQATGETIKPEVLAQIILEVRQSIQPELDALNRAVRRYEKKTALMAFQTETRMNQLDTQVQDAIALAAAAQRSASDHRQSFALVLLDWMAAVVIVPVRMVMQLVSLPGRMASFCLQNVSASLGGGKRRRKGSKGKQVQRTAMSERRYLGTPPQGSVVSGILPVKKGS